MRVLPLLLAALLLAAVFAGCGKNRADGSIRKAVAAADAGDWETALKFADQGVRQSPDNVDALLLKATSAQRCQRPEVAYEAAAKAVELAPNYFLAQYTLGSVCMEIPRRKNEAKRAFKAALALRGDDRDTLIALCDLMAETNDPELLTYLNKLKKRDPKFAENSAAFHNQKGVALLRSNPNMALMNFDRALKLDGKWTDPAIVYNAACAYDRYRPSARQLTVRLYRRYLQLTQNDKSAERTRALVQQRLKELGGR